MRQAVGWEYTVAAAGKSFSHHSIIHPKLGNSLLLQVVGRKKCLGTKLELQQFQVPKS